MAQGKTTDALLALYEFVCGESARLSHALNRDATWQKILARLFGKVERRLLSLSAEAYGRGTSPRAFEEWTRREIPPLVGAFVNDVRASQDPVEATQRFFSSLQNLNLPQHFRGKYKRPRPPLLPSGGALLKEFENLVRRGRAVMGSTHRLLALLDAFPDVPQEVLDRPRRFVPERFAKEALAARYGSSVEKVASALRQARKARPAPSSS